MVMGFALSRRLARVIQPVIRFVFLGSGFCLRLLSGSTSRWIYPCLRLTVSTIRTGRGLPPPNDYPCRAQVRHPPQSGWLDELGLLKGGRPLCLTPINLKSFSPFGKLNPTCLHELGHISNGEKGIAGFLMPSKMEKAFLLFKHSCLLMLTIGLDPKGFSYSTVKPFRVALVKPVVYLTTELSITFSAQDLGNRGSRNPQLSRNLR
jgi:hypothetical protein